MLTVLWIFTLCWFNPYATPVGQWESELAQLHTFAECEQMRVDLGTQGYVVPPVCTPIAAGLVWSLPPDTPR